MITKILLFSTVFYFYWILHSYFYKKYKNINFKFLIGISYVFFIVQYRYENSIRKYKKLEFSYYYYCDVLCCAAAASCDWLISMLSPHTPLTERWKVKEWETTKGHKIHIPYWLISCINRFVWCVGVVLIHSTPYFTV